MAALMEGFRGGQASLILLGRFKMTLLRIVWKYMKDYKTIVSAAE